MEKEKWQLEEDIRKLEEENARLRQSNQYYADTLADEREKRKALESMNLAKSSVIEDYSAQLQTEAQKAQEQTRKGVSPELGKVLNYVKPRENSAISNDSILKVAIERPSSKKATREELWAALKKNGTVVINSDGSIAEDDADDDDGEEYEYSELDFEEVDETLQPKGPDGEYLDPDEAYKNGHLHVGLGYEQ